MRGEYTEYTSHGLPQKMIKSLLPIFHGGIAENKKDTSNVSFLRFKTLEFDQFKLLKLGVGRYVWLMFHTVHLLEHNDLVIIESEFRTHLLDRNSKA